MVSVVSNGDVTNRAKSELTLLRRHLKPLFTFRLLAMLLLMTLMVSRAPFALASGSVRPCPDHTRSHCVLLTSGARAGRFVLIYFLPVD